MTLTTFQKNFLFVLLSCTALGGGILAANTIRLTYIERAEQRRLQDLKKRVERVMALNVCAHIKDAEQARLDKADKDPVETRKILLAIHKERLETWQSNVRFALQNMERYSQLHRDSPSYISYLPEFNRAKKEAATALDEAFGFEKAVKALEAHDVNAPFEGPKAPEKALDTPTPPSPAGRI